MAAREAGFRPPAHLPQMKPGFLLATLLLLLAACSLWEYEDPSRPLENTPPETYLSLVALDTIYAGVDTVISGLDPVSGDTLYDTLWSYVLDSAPDTALVWDTLTAAFTTITTSRQQLHWWGEDPDGDVIGYRYKWSSDTSWSYTTREAGLFYVPIRTAFDVFSFQVVALDDDSLPDPTPARLTLPIRNSPPAVHFRYRSNPLLADMPGDTALTFPTRTFVWDIEDQDGLETVTDIFYALDDTCDACWQRLDAGAYSSLTLTEIAPGLHVFYLKARDIAGAVSPVARFPDPENVNEPDYWRVMPVNGRILLVDDFHQDSQNKARDWYRGVLDTLGSVGGEYSVWEIGRTLPFSAVDINATLNYFDHVIWYTAYTGIERYNEAGANIYNYIMQGGNLFLCAAELKDTSFVWFPIDSSFVLNTTGRLLTGRILHSQIDSTLDLQLSSLIAIRVKGFEPHPGDLLPLACPPHNRPRFRSLYRLQQPEGPDTWLGTPNVCASYFFELAPCQFSGKVVLMSLPLHNGSQAVLEGLGSAGKFIKYLLDVEFAR